MTEYIIKQSYESNCFSYCHDTGHIGLKMTDVVLSDIELSEYISDGLTHEHIHKTLDELFNHTVCKLFDGIEHYFGNYALHEKVIRKYNQTYQDISKRETYKTYIKKHGFTAFLNYYGITQEDMEYAKKRCRFRRLINEKR